MLTQTLKNTIRNISVLLLLFFAGVTCANAQSVGFSFGLGTATNSANGQSLDSFGDVGPKLGGLFATFAGDYMFRPSLGFGAEYSFRTSQGNYAPQVGVNYRPVFYDFNAIWHPVPSQHSRGSRVPGRFGRRRSEVLRKSNGVRDSRRLHHAQSIHRKLKPFSAALFRRRTIVRKTEHLYSSASRCALGEQFSGVRQFVGS